MNVNIYLHAENNSDKELVFEVEQLKDIHLPPVVDTNSIARLFAAVYVSSVCKEIIMKTYNTPPPPFHKHFP